MKNLWVIGGADGPTAIYITGRKGQKPAVFLKAASIFSLLFLAAGTILHVVVRRKK